MYIHPEGAEYVAEKILELMKDYDLTIHYHPEKANIVASALS